MSAAGENHDLRWRNGVLQKDSCNREDPKLKTQIIKGHKRTAEECSILSKNGIM
jgi:hypothetical protein